MKPWSVAVLFFEPSEVLSLFAPHLTGATVSCPICEKREGLRFSQMGQDTVAPVKCGANNESTSEGSKNKTATDHGFIAVVLRHGVRGPGRKVCAGNLGDADGAVDHSEFYLAGTLGLQTQLDSITWNIDVAECPFAIFVPAGILRLSELVAIDPAIDDLVFRNFGRNNACVT